MSGKSFTYACGFRQKIMKPIYCINGFGLFSLQIYILCPTYIIFFDDVTQGFDRR